MRPHLALYYERSTRYADKLTIRGDFMLRKLTTSQLPIGRDSWKYFTILISSLYLFKYSAGVS